MEPPEARRNHPKQLQGTRNHPKPPTIFLNSDKTSQKNIRKNTISLVPPIRPNLVTKV